MKHLLKYLVLCVVLLNSFSCKKKKYPESVIENQPVYYSKFDVNGRPMEFKAGENNFYMYSDVLLDTAEVNEHTSTMRRSDCGGCGPSLKFVIRDYQVSSATNPSKIDSTIHTGHYEYLKNVKAPYYEAQFTAVDNNGVGLSYDWDFGDGIKVKGKSVTHTFNYGAHKVCVSMQTSKGCVSNLCNDHFIASNSLNCFITASADSNTKVDFTAHVTGGVAPYTYYWEFGDGFATFDDSHLSHSYPFEGSYLVRLTVFDGNKIKMVTQYNAVTKNDLSSCAVNFSRTSLTEISQIEQSLSKVRIVYTDEQGVSYQTLGIDQPTSSYFEILDIKEGEPNENGRPTKMVNVRFNCEVVNGTQKLTISNGLSTISVAY